MRGTEFYSVFESHGFIANAFLGVFSIDTCPTQLNIEEFFICNTQKAGEAGKHWFLVHRPNSWELELFDSLGIVEEFISKNIPPYSPTAIGNTTRLQPLNSKNCGKFCCYFILQRILNYDLTLEEVLNTIFSLDCEDNDRNVVDFLTQ